MIETMVKHFHEIFIRKRIVDLHLLIVTPRIAEILATNRERIAGMILIKGKNPEVPVGIEIDLRVITGRSSLYALWEDFPKTMRLQEISGLLRAQMQRV